MITKRQRKNAERIVELDRAFGHLAYNDYGQTVRDTLNLSIPCATLIVAGVVTGVDDSNDSVNDNAVADVERLCKEAVIRTTGEHGVGWWSESARKLALTI